MFFFFCLKKKRIRELCKNYIPKEIFIVKLKRDLHVFKEIMFVLKKLVNKEFLFFFSCLVSQFQISSLHALQSSSTAYFSQPNSKKFQVFAEYYSSTLQETITSGCGKVNRK